jgi:ribosomal protein S20
MDAVADAVQAGDISSAQQALKTLKSDMPSASDTSTQGTDAIGKARRALSALHIQGTSQSSDTDTDSDDTGATLKSQVDALFAAIEKGDLTSAQSALTTLQSNMPQPPAMGPPGGDTGSSELATSLNSLFDAVKSGDTTKAQAALDTIEKQGGLSADGDGAIDKDLDALFSAVKSGDMKTAQSSLDTLSDDMQSAMPPPPPQGFGFGGMPGGLDGSASSDAANAMKSTFDDLSSVFSAIEKGDMTAAQKALTSLKSDQSSLQALFQPSTASTAASTVTSGYLDTTTT